MGNAVDSTHFMTGVYIGRCFANLSKPIPSVTGTYPTQWIMLMRQFQSTVSKFCGCLRWWDVQ